MNKRFEGKSGEDAAIRFLTEEGAVILERNFTLKDAEIDLIYTHDDYLVFGEVKYRTTQMYGSGYEAVSLAKRKRISKACRVYMYRHRYPLTTPVRFDVISIDNNAINWIKNAFDYVY